MAMHAGGWRAPEREFPIAMKEQDIPETFRPAIEDFCRQTGTQLESIAFWDLRHHGLFVSRNEHFYQTRTIAEGSPISFVPDPSATQGEPGLPDIRTLIEPLYTFLSDNWGLPTIIDVGGYLGRFSIESAIMLKAKFEHPPSQYEGRKPIVCFEPGPMRLLLETNIGFNGLTDWVLVLPYAVADKSAQKTFQYRTGRMIGGRLARPSGSQGRVHHSVFDTIRSALGRMRTKRLKGKPVQRDVYQFDVPACTLKNYCEQAGLQPPFIVKIDTEGGEPEVFNGLSRDQIANSVFIVELWPQRFESRVHGHRYLDFLQSEFVIWDIRNSLYPANFNLIEDLEEFSRSKEKGMTTDLLLIPKSCPRIDGFADRLNELRVRRGV